MLRIKLDYVGSIVEGVDRISVYPLIIDIRTELERYSWHNATWTHDKLVCASPTRYDRTPSFYVWLVDSPITGARAGDWGDYGAMDSEWSRGGFVKLLSFLRNETYGETVEYLRYTYGESSDDPAQITLKIPKLIMPERRVSLDLRILDELKFRSPYLESRGISEEIQRLYNVGYDRQRRAVTFPWILADDKRLGNVKYRKTTDKAFFYAKGGMPIRSMVYGINLAYRLRVKTAVICEAEIDGMSASMAGTLGLAIGGANFTDAQADLIKKSPIERIIIGTDNDNAGRAVRDAIVRKLTGYCELADVIYPSECKDTNDILRVKGVSELQRTFKDAIKTETSLSNIAS